MFDLVYGPMGDAPLNDRLEDATAACMADRGWDYFPETGEVVAVFLKLGMSEADFASTYGFGLTRQPEIPELAQRARNESVVQALSPAARMRYADELEVCGLQAKEEVDPLATQVFTVLGMYQDEVLTRLLASDVGQTALFAWRTCLGTELAQDATNMSELVQRVGQYLATTDSTDEEAAAFEVGLATRAIECNLDRRSLEAGELAMLETNFIEEHAEQVGALLEVYQHAQ